MKKLWKIGAAAFVLLSAVGVTSARAQAHLGSQGGQGANVFTSLCLRPVNGDGSNGVQLQQVICDPYDASFYWTLEPVLSSGGTVWNHVRNQATGKCLDDTNGNTADRTVVQQWDCGSSTTMLWRQGQQNGAAVMLINLRSGKCLDAGTSYPFAGTFATIYHCAPNLSGTTTPNLAQFWRWF